MSHNNRVWTTALGRKRNFKKIGHQHLSNILWFNEVFHGLTWKNCHTMRQLQDELSDRYNGIKKPWKPLPIPCEIGMLINMGLLDDNKNIVFQGRIIGSIKHIK